MLPQTDEEKRAVNLYVVLSRDSHEFVEELDTADDATLRVLYLMLTTDHPDLTRSDREINDFGGRIVKARLERRSLPLPKAF